MVEVLSPATEAQDRREKRALYETLESVEVYLLVDLEGRRFTLYRRTPKGFVEKEGEEASIPSLDLILRAEEAFRL